MNLFDLRQGSAPLIVSIPHAGLEIPDDCTTGLRSITLARHDADWWLPQLYDFAAELDATIIINRISRTVIDANRDPSGVSLYPGQFTTGLCPVETFDGESLYAGGAPDTDEIARRRVRYFEPYHAALAGEIERLRAQNPSIVLYDCHSIRSEIAPLFKGILPNFNIGTNDGTSCGPAIADRVLRICEAAEGFTAVANGRFKGGYITRHHGDPGSGVNAIQMELACRGYMLEPAMATTENWPTNYDADYAAPMRKVLRSVLESFV